MGIGSASIVLVVCALAQAPARAQSRFYVKGEWVVTGAMANPGGGQAQPAPVAGGIYGDRFSAKQTATTLSLELSVAVLPKPLLVVYALDGSESKNMNPLPGGGEEPIYSTAKWEGSRLVIDTRGTRVLDGKVQTSRRVLSMTPDGLLQVERSAEGQPTTRSFYKRAR